MKRFLSVILFSAGLAAGQGGDLDNQPAPRAVPVEDLLPKFSDAEAVVSHTEQFRIYGGTSADRGTAANLAEQTKEELLRLTEEKDEWKIPIKIRLIGAEGGEVRELETALGLFHNDNTYEVHIYVSLSRGLRNEPLKRAVMEALVYAKGLRDRPFEKDVPFTVPPWVVEGLSEATAWRLKKSDRKLYDAVFRSGGFYKLDDLFGLSDGDFLTIDGASRAAFRVSSGALMMALLEEAGGKDGICNFLDELAAYQGEMPVLLRRHFPDLNLSESSLAKLWMLQLANKGTAPLTESLGVLQTEAALAAALKLRFTDVEGVFQEVSIDDWQVIAALEEKERAEAVRPADEELVRLSYRSFPSYRMLLLEYQGVLEDLVEGETGNIAASLEALATTRSTMLEKAEQARDFMDWFQITRARETSGAFEDYLRLKAQLKTRTHRRKDHISEYLDRLEPLFDVPEPERYDPFALDFPEF
ncbi:MAG: hypothetical protein NWT08_06755 [Akkermansiaceae bacterium]|jgi:hypothetical protein|nr:hypothetical protein [Akkermansiaceae bacterium]MDP4647389.1 hypothetical protein [Akkermansiaceae bacterium]MDP4721597.1 hypothetical protein [Akkermansiaceae bacterium]MDP4779541.1 hypothetical protein [Akkermansiaceae bacterium]MDP4847359.1 hypothetical protein [Akkermansiaceae bacterium]